MGEVEVPRGLKCPRCGEGLEPHETPVADEPTHRMVCPSCREVYRARRRKSQATTESPPPKSSRLPDPKPLGDLSLRWRYLAVRLLSKVYPVGVTLGAATLFACGGFVPVIRGWMDDEVKNWGDVVETLGGLRIVTETQDPDADLGVVLVRLDAPTLFHEVNVVARRLGVKPPDQIRLAYLPCCGVVGWRHSQILLLGLPLLQVLTVAEFRAVLAHELTHLARGDVSHSTGASRFVEGLSQAIERDDDRLRGPLGVWARWCCRLSSRLETPIARGQEARADRTSAAIAGGGAAASALVKVAMVQPLFREVLDHHDPTNEDLPNLYAFFRSFWRRLPNEMREAMRLQVLVNGTPITDSPHPALPDRLAVLQAFPEHPEPASDRSPSATLIGDLEAFEQLLHNRLFRDISFEPTVFHRVRA